VKKADGGLIAGRQQASNHVDIVFPATPGDAASATTGGVNDQFGVVVPNALSTPTEAKGVADSVTAAGNAAIASTTAASANRRPADLAPAGAVPDNAFLQATQNPVSGFPAETGTSGYADVRRSLLNGRRPSRATVRLEELVNFFRYDYAALRPDAREPIAASLEVASAPWEPRHRLVRIALKARDLPADAHGAIVARDVAVQVEFSPAQVQAYRLLGYENPGPAGGRPVGETADVRDIRPGQTITAFYEIVPASGPNNPASERPVLRRLLAVTVRYRMPDRDEDRSLEFPLVDKGAAFADASSDFRFAAAVAEFGLVLRDSPYKAGATMADVLHWAEQAAGADPDGARSEFIALVKRAGAVLASQG
jgi:hypothetical protein